MNIELWKKRKKELNLTHNELAKISGISRRTIAGIFSNDPTRCSPTRNTTEAIEKALGLNQHLDWTDEEKALGVGRHAPYISEDDYEWLELKSEILRIHGENYLNTLKTMLKAITKE